MQNIAFRNVFLMTFRSFVSPERLFELLVMRYQMVPPPNLTTEESEAWKEQKLRPTQQRVLTTIKIWVEDYNFMDEGSHLIRSLTDFLNSIITPTPLGLTAQHILQSLEKRVSKLDFLPGLLADTCVLRLQQSRPRSLHPGNGGKRRRTRAISSSWNLGRLPNTCACTSKNYMGR